jgi:uncharacterized protein YgiM (DUF1202 family)
MNNNATNQSQNCNNHSRSQFNYTKWGFVVAIVGVIAAILATPSDAKCFVLNSNACTVSKTDNKVQYRNFSLLVRNNQGEDLGGVKVLVIGSGIPEPAITDNNGYAQVKIPSKGDVRISISKENYEAHDLIINLENEQQITRVVQLMKKNIPTIKSQVPESSINPNPQGGHPKVNPSPRTFSTEQPKSNKPKSQEQTKSNKPKSQEQPKSNKPKSQEQPKDTQQSSTFNDTSSSTSPEVPEVKTEACNVFVVYDPGDSFVHLRKTANNGEVIQKVNNGTKVHIDNSQASGDWRHVILENSTSGYMKSNLLKQINTHYVFDKNDTYANLRSAPDKNADILRPVQNATPVKILTRVESGKWLEVRLNTDQKVGFISSERIADPSCGSN